MPLRRRRSRFGGRIALLFAAMVAAVAIAAPSAAAAPFTCSAAGLLFNGSDITAIDLATGEATPAGTSPGVNAVGYNPKDNFIYGWRNSTDELLRLHSDGSFDVVGMPFVPTGESVNVGDFDDQGFMYLSGPSPFTYWVVDLTDPSSPTYGEVVQSGTVMLAPDTNMPADWVWINGSLYGVAANTADPTAPARLVRVNPATGAMAVVAELPGLPSEDSNGERSQYGAVFTDAKGNLYAYHNHTGLIYRINPTTGAYIQLSKGPEESGGDGTRCSSAPIPTITVRKTVEGRIQSADQFTVGLANQGGTTLTSATTAGGSTTASTVDWPVSEGKTYTISDAMAAGSPNAIGEYVKSIACTDASGAAVPVGGSGPLWTMTVAKPTDYTCNVTNKAEADVEIEKSSKARIVPGKPATYTLKVTNKGPSKAINAEASDPLPKGVSFASASNGCSEAGGKVTCKVASLAVGASQTFEVNVKVASSAKCSELENTATVISEVFDPDEGNNSSSVRNCGPESDLEIRKTPSSAKVSPNGQVTYTLVVKNNGPSDNSNVTVSDPMASGLALESAKPSQGSCSTAGGKVSCKLGDLQAGGSAQVLVTAKMTSSSECVENAAEVIGDGFDPKQSNNRDDAEICPRPEPPPIYDLVVQKKASKKQIVADENVKYTITVANKGPDTAPGVKLTDTFNHKAKLVSVKTTNGSCGKALPLSCSLGDLAKGAKATITVVLKPLSTGCGQRNVASATGEGTDTNPANNLSRANICVAPKLEIVKKVDRDSVEAGGIVNYKIKVTNLSKRVAAEDVRTCDSLPAGLAYVASKPKAKLSRGMHCWTKSLLGGGKSVVYRVTTKALRGASGRERNVATVKAAGLRGKALSDVALVRVRGQAPRATPVTG